MAESANPQQRYQLGKVLGRGGMGVVYKAYDTQMNREVALKTLLDVDNTAALELFYKEWGLLATIVHPNIVGIYDVGEFEQEGVKRPFFTMPLLRGVTLEQLIRERSARLTVENTIAILTQACRGLQAAHELGLIHRDMKPSNIFVMEDDSVKLIDFGIARLARMASGTALKGTVYYMAPEQFQMKPPSPLSDLFSLAVVSYETLSGRRPFQGATDSEVIAAVLHQNPPAPSDLNPNINYAISQVIHKGLAKQPWHRFQSAKEFGEALQKAVRNEPLEFFDVAAIQPRIERAARTFEQGDYDFASELLAELEGEGHLDPKITLLRRQLDQAMRQVRIGKLLETARRFFEAHEHSLALRRVDDALELDRENADVLALKSQIEKARSARKMHEWTQVARQSLQNLEFRQAREAVDSLVKLRPNDPEILRLRTEIDRREQELHRSREQKARLYKLAMEGWERGDIAAAFNRLEALLALVRDQPDPSGQNDMYQKFYDQVRAERDTINAAYDEARRQFGAGNFDPALVICRQYLMRFPSHALFQALRCDVEEKRRQAMSSFVAEVDRRVEQEPDPEKRVAILEAALAQHPGDPQLERALSLAREKRDLVASIKNRGRYLEEHGQYSEALDQWEILRAVDPAYPGLEAERERAAQGRERAAQGRERQSQLEARSRWMGEIERLQRAGDHEGALQAVGAARVEFPEDADLAAIAESVRRGRERTQEAMTLLQQSRQLDETGQPEEALRLAEQAHEVEPSDNVVTTVLVNSLLEQAQRVMGADPDAAESMVDRILALDPQHAEAQQLRQQIATRRREEYLEWCGWQARRLKEAGDTTGARAVLEQGLLTYPEEPRLVELREELEGRGAEPAAKTELAERPAVEELEREPTPAAGPAVKRKPLPAKPRGPAVRRWLPAVALAAIFVVAVAVVSVVARGKRSRTPAPVPAETRVVSLSALPPGAAIVVNGQPCGVSQCEPRLAPGTYLAEARLAGYQTATVEFTVGPAGVAPVLLTLVPSGTVVRVASDLENAAVLVDDKPAGQIQNGEFELRTVAAGTHTVTVLGPSGRATVSFEAADALPPWLRRPLEPGGLRTIVVAGLGPTARAWANLKAGEATLDGQAAGALTTEGVQLNNLAEGSHELALGAGGAQHKIVFTSEAIPLLTAFIGADTSLGSLRITASEDEVAVFLNGQRQKRTTQKGRLLLSLAPRKYTVRVAKEGFLPPPEQTVEIQRGEETRLEFKLAAPPKFAAFRLRNGTPGAEVMLDGTHIGTVGADGMFVFPKLDPPGKHTVTMRKESHQPRQFDMDFPAGVTSELEGGLETTLGTLRIEATPAPPEIRLTLRREGEADRTVGETTMPLPEGTYRVTGSANGYQAGSVTVRVTAGRTATAALALRRVEVPQPVAKAPVLTLADWEKTGGWTREGPLLVRRGGNVVVAPLAPLAGSYNFTILLQRGSRLEWLLNYVDDRNYVQYQLDKTNFSRVEMVNGRRGEAVRAPHRVDRDTYISVQIDVSSEAVIHRLLRAEKWEFLDEFRKAGGNMLAGPFAFRVTGRDQVGLSDFRFLAR